MNIAFWSNAAGKGATSGNMLAIGTMTSVLYSLRTILIQTDRMSKPIEEVFEGKRSENIVGEEFNFYTKKGMDEIVERGRMDLLDEDIIRTNLINVKHTNIYYISSAKEEMDNSEDTKAYYSLMKKLNNMGEINFWDVSNGDSHISKTILSQSDVVVINISQDGEYPKISLDDDILKKAVFIVGRYDNGSRKGINHICKKYGINRENIGVIPYNIHFSDAISEGKIVPFIMRNIFSKKYEANFEFINNLFKSTNLVLKKAGVAGIG